MDYTTAIEKLTSKGMFRIELGLERIKKALEILGNPQNDLKYIHVAGTNGKGSVCSILDSVLQEAGYKTGLFTSPHIFEYTERIKVNGIKIPKDEFGSIFEEVYKLQIDLTEFEMLTIIGFVYFKRQNVDIVILETGMGGRFDATNVIKDNLCSIITHIDLDHTDRLGKTKEEIAFEKAGIIKHGCPVITFEGYEAIKDKADEMDSMMIMINPSVSHEFAEALALKGKHQIENLALALEAVNYIFPEIDYSVIIKGLKKVRNPFRFEYFKDKNLIIDVAHNPNSIEVLRENLDLYYPNIKRRYIFGCLKRKDYRKMMDILFREGDEIYLNEFGYEGACSFDELAKACPFPAHKYEKQDLKADKLNIICGSFYMLNELLNLI